MQFRDLRTQYDSLKPDIDSVITEVLSSGCFIGGETVRELELRLADYVGTRHCITCGNGTDALQLALMAWNIGKGDAVIVPDFTFFSSGEVVSAIGATPVFVDVDKSTFNLNPAQIESAFELAKRNGLTPRAVIVVDLFGLPADYPAIRSICKKLNLSVLEDGAQGFGGSINRKKACSFGDISTTSFFPAKPLGCYGDGGAIFTDDDDSAALIRSYAVHGKGAMKYDNVRVGMNSRLDTIQAAILQIKLRAFIDHELNSVNVAANTYTNELQDIAEEYGIILPYVPNGYHSSWAQYTIQLPEQTNREKLMSLLKDNGIPTMVYYPKPMHEQTAFYKRCIYANNCEITKRLCDTVLSLPIGPYCSSEMIDIVTSGLKHCLLRTLRKDYETA